MKGLFIPDITAEMFRNGCLESIESLMAEGEVYDIEYDPKSEEPETNWISCKERLPEKPDNYPHCGIYRTYFLVSLESGCVKSLAYEFERDEWQTTGSPVIAWQPLPESYKKEGDKDGR